MTSPTPWAHLPNAPYIDSILADLKARPEVWDAARDAAWAAAQDAAQDAARDAARDATRDAARDATRDAAWAAAWAATQDAARDAAWAAAWAAARDAAWAAACALVAWDDVTYILALPPDAVRMLIETCTDHHKHAGILLLPACYAFEPTKEKQHG